MMLKLANASEAHQATEFFLIHSLSDTVQLERDTTEKRLILCGLFSFQKVKAIPINRAQCSVGSSPFYSGEFVAHQGMNIFKNQKEKRGNEKWFWALEDLTC
jgi:hypothetical protein